MSDISSHYGDLDPLYIFSHYADHDPSDLCILYVVMTTYVIFCIMPIHGHCTLMYPGLLMYLQLYAELYHRTMLIGWLVFHWVLHHSTYGMDL